VDNAQTLNGAAQEWLRRIALNRARAIVPEPVAIGLIGMGYAARFADGSLAATAAGRAHLDMRGIAHTVTRVGRQRRPV
jgi:hypothetical protein